MKDLNIQVLLITFGFWLATTVTMLSIVGKISTLETQVTLMGNLQVQQTRAINKNTEATCDILNKYDTILQ